MAIAATCIWEVSQAGSDSNGGGFNSAAAGVDRTYPTSNPQAIGDLKTDGATLTVMASATYTFTADDVGNIVSVNVTDSGGLATVGRYEVTSVTGGKATVDRAWATANNTGTAGATAVLGGAFATPGQAGKTLSTANEKADLQKVFIKAGTYTLSTATAGSGGPFLSNAACLIAEGYETTRGDLGAKPVLDAGAQTSVILWKHGRADACYFVNLKADGQSGSGNKGFACTYFYSSVFKCEAVDCDQSSCYGFTTGRFIDCKASNCYDGFVDLYDADGCSAIGCQNDGFRGAAGRSISGCLAHACVRDGFQLYGSQHVTNCTADANGRYGFNGSFTSGGYVDFVNCIATNHNGSGDKGFTGNSFSRWNTMTNCATYNNTSNDTPRVQIGLVTLSADPYVNQAGDDFRPNDTAGGGAALRAAGIGVYGQTDNRDIGAVQHTDSGGGYTYGDEDPDQVLTTADGAGNYVPIADSDTVDGGVSYGAGEEGTGVNQATIEGILDARGITTDNIALTNQPLDATETQSAAAAAIAAAEPIDANVTQVAGVSFAEGVREALGMADADMDDQLDAILVQATAAAEDSGGTGARTCVITVDDGTDPLESARVRVTKGAESWLQTTGVSGEATFNLDDGSWTVAITLAGYTFSGDTLVVDGNKTETYSMTAAGFTPSVEPDSVTVRWRVIDEDGRPCGAGEGTVRIRLIAGPNVAGFAWDKSERISTTDANGYVEFPDVPAGCTLRAKLGTASAGGEWFDVTIPSDATSPYEPGEILGTVP